MYIQDCSIPKFGFHTDATYASMRTCPASCALRGHGCYAEQGNVGYHVRRYEQSVWSDAAGTVELARIEAAAICGSWGGGRVPPGQILRLHVAGDFGGTKSARVLADAAANWIKRGGSMVWTYTHNWRAVARDAFGQIAISASTESVDDVPAILAQGYSPALVVKEHGSTIVAHGVRFMPCQHQTTGKTCRECGLCMRTDLRERGLGVAFAAHGSQAAKVRLVVTN